MIDKGKILGMAQKYVLKGQSKKAIVEYLKLIEANPEDKRLHLKLGDLYLRDGDNRKAIKAYLKVAQLYADEDLSSSAISIYKKILSIDPKSVEAFHEIAKLYVKQGLVGSARSSYQRILEIDPNNQSATREIERLDELQGSAVAPPPLFFQNEPFLSEPPLPPEEESEETGVAAPAVRSESTGLFEGAPPDKDSQMHYHLGIAYREMELFDYAITEFEQACSDDGMKFDCYIMLGNCFMDKREFDRSIEAYQTALEIEGLPGDKVARLRYNLGLAYEAKGMIEEAIDTFNLALKSDHLFAEAQECLKRLREK